MPGPSMQSLKKLYAEQDQIDRELTAPPFDRPLLHPALASLYRQLVERLDELLADPNAKPQAFELIGSLIEEVRLVPDQGQLAVELKGDLAGILAITQSGDGSAAGNRALQVKMVAGAGFEPTTFRL